MPGLVLGSNAARRVVSETPEGGGDGRNGDRNGAVTVHQPGDQSGGDIARLVIARVAS